MHLPIFLRVRDRPCLVVGGGRVAARKIELLTARGARVTVVAPRLNQRVAELRDLGRLHHLPRVFRDDDLDDCDLVFVATDNRETNRRISELARARHLPVNVVDEPALCTFTMPSIVQREPVQIAVSTGGASPVLARVLRARLETMVPASYGRLAALMATFRQRASERFPDADQRRRFWERVVHGPVAEMLFAGQEARARKVLAQQLASDGGVERDALSRGEVYLVGGGPGDPDLLTFRALRLLQQADVVVYDRLVAPAIVELARKDAERVYVGKESDRHALSQQAINELLARLARAGKRVVRLKGGDPFIFGRGGEEIDTLSAEGIPFQVVPGITAAAGCAAYAGIPLTHRDYAHSCVFVTGHLKEGRLDLDWSALVQPMQTIAIYMGVHGIGEISAGLISHGLAADTPSAVVEGGTLPRQRVLITTLGELPELVRASEVKPPSMIIVGEVVKLRDKLAWFTPDTA